MIYSVHAGRGTMPLLKFVLVFGLVTPFAFAQQDNASILGTVMDSSNAVVPNASVEIHNAGTNQALKLLTDPNGNFFAPVMPVGVYRISVTAAGFKVEVLDGLALRVADRLKITIKLEPGTVKETVTIIGSAPLVDTASTTLGGVVSSQQVNALPMNGRDLVELLALVPGMVL